MFWISLAKGVESIYRCHNVKRRGQQCTAGIYTLKDHDSSDGVRLFRRQAEHSCEQSRNKTKPKKLDETVKNFILDQHKLKNQVNHVLRYYKEKTPNPSVFISEMENFAKEHNKLPEDENTVFVVNFECSPPRMPENGTFFRIIFSTKRLLTYAFESDIVHADGTHFDTVPVCPVLVVGISDADKCFHMSGLAITSHHTFHRIRTEIVFAPTNSENVLRKYYNELILNN